MKIKASSGLWLLVGALVCIIILVLGLFLIVFPQRNKVGEVEDEIASTETSIQLEQNRLNQLRQYDKDPDQFLRQIDVLQERIPQNVELADIIQQIDHAAEEAGLDFYSITPKVPVAAGNYYTVTCEAIFHGRYFNLIEFFNHIERLPRSVKVVFLDITASDGGLPYLQVRVDFRAFFTTNQGIEGLVQSPAG
jgi:Tfp pilus assembly protein PilO